MINQDARLESNRTLPPDVCAARFAVAGALLLSLAGCSGGDGTAAPPTAAVSGTVTLDGQPLANAEVNFVTEDFAGFAITDENGAYHLAQGAAVGPNKVYISKIEVPEGFDLNPEEGMDLEQLRAAGGIDGDVMDPTAVPGELIPPEYSDPEQTRLEFDVPEGGTESANFSL